MGTFVPDRAALDGNGAALVALAQLAEGSRYGL